MSKGISRETIEYVGILIVLTLFLALILILFNEEVMSAVSKLTASFEANI